MKVVVAAKQRCHLWNYRSLRSVFGVCRFVFYHFIPNSEVELAYITSQELLHVPFCEKLIAIQVCNNLMSIKTSLRAQYISMSYWVSSLNISIQNAICTESAISPWFTFHREMAIKDSLLLICGCVTMNIWWDDLRRVHYVTSWFVAYCRP